MLGSFSFRDCLQDGHSQTIVPDPLFSSVPFPLLPQLGVNSRYHLPKIGCRPQDKAPFFQSGKYQVWTLKSLGRWSNICEFTCINNPFISGQKVHCIAFLSPLRNKKKKRMGGVKRYLVVNRWSFLSPQSPYIMSGLVSRSTLSHKRCVVERFSQ